MRFLLAVGVGSLTTFALFWAMQALIGVSGELKEGRPPPHVEFVRLRKDTTPETKEREPPKREKPEQPPPPPEMNLAKNINPGEAVGEIVPMVDTAAELGEATSLGAGGGSREVVPLVRVDPEYPIKAKQRGVEGWVDIEFSISPAGTVEDARVLGAYPPAVFEQSALRAVRRWRYTPKTENGVAVSRHGIKVRLRFELGGT